MLLQGMLLSGVVSSRDADAAPYDRLAVRGVASSAFVGVLVWRLVQ
jgi:hypothetical protein